MKLTTHLHVVPREVKNSVGIPPLPHMVRLRGLGTTLPFTFYEYMRVSVKIEVALIWTVTNKKSREDLISVMITAIQFGIVFVFLSPV
jgi:hypothetical protein